VHRPSCARSPARWHCRRNASRGPAGPVFARRCLRQRFSHRYGTSLVRLLNGLSCARIESRHDDRRKVGGAAKIRQVHARRAEDRSALRSEVTDHRSS
jgi:hypothetical protein